MVFEQATSTVPDCGQGQPVGPQTGTRNNIEVGNGHIWDGPTPEVKENLGSSGTAERLPNR